MKKEMVEWQTFRITLPGRQRSLMEINNKTREEVLKSVFTKTIKTELRFRPLEYYFTMQIGSYIIGRLQFARKAIINSKSNDSKEIIGQEEKDWHEIILIVNIDENYQTITTSYNSKFGKTLPKLKEIAEIIKNKASSYGYGCEIRVILEQKYFWDVVRKDDIRKVVMSASSPNFFEGDLTKEAGECEKRYKSDKITKSFESSANTLTLKEDDEGIKSALIQMEVGEVDIELYGKKDGKKQTIKLFDSKNGKHHDSFSTPEDIVEQLKEDTEGSRRNFFSSSLFGFLGKIKNKGTVKNERDR